MDEEVVPVVEMPDPEMVVMTVVLEDGSEPRIELDGCHTQIAVAVFRQAADMLEAITTRPTITTHGDVLTSEEDYVFYFETDDDE